MNVFVLDTNPNTAAQMLCDCHVRKMCVETAQILSGVMLRRGMHLLDEMPKPQNINHPVIVAVETPGATNWVWLHLFFLCAEFRIRFGKTHKYGGDGIVHNYFSELITQDEDEDCTTLAKCCGDLDVADLDIVTAYRKYYTEVKKTHLAAKNLWKFTCRKDWTE